MQVKILFFLHFVFIVILSKAQVLTSSPLSYYGLGQKSIGSDAIFQSLAYSTVSMADSGVINYNNPATYSSFGSGYTLFSTGIHAQFSQFTESGNSTSKAYSNLNHLILGTKLTKFVSTSFGLRPYSFRGYAFNNRVFTGTDSLLYEYKGTGTSQIVYAGFSLKVFNFISTKFSLGANVGYLFGSLSNDRYSRIIASNNAAGGVEKRLTTMTSLYYQFGGHVKQRITKSSSLDLGISYEPTQQLDSKRTIGLYYSNNIFNEKIFDTILYQNIKGNVAMPSNLNLGLGYTLSYKNLVKNNRKLNSEIKFFLNFSYRDYSKYQENFDSLSLPNTLGKTDRLSFGIQWIPERNYFESNTLTKFYQHVYYRIGFFNETSYFTNSNYKIEHFGTTFGIGIPIFAQQSLSSVNFGITLGRMEKNIENSLVENYARINFGVILSPSFFDKWFRKRKLD